MDQDAKNLPEVEHEHVAEVRGDDESYQEESITWQAPEYVYHEKSTNWYWILGIIALTAIIIGFLLSNILFSIFSLIAGLAVALFSAKKPEVFEYQVNEQGLRINNKLYPYPTLDIFWVDDETGDTILIAESKKPLVPQIVIPVEGIPSAELRDFLRDYLPEEYIERPWAQVIMERIGF